MESVKGIENGRCYRATFDVAHYQKTGQIVYTSSPQPFETNLEPEIMDLLQYGDVGTKRISYMLDKDKFLHIANQTRMTDKRLAMYFGCTAEVICALKKRYGVPDAYNQQDEICAN